MKRQTYAEGNIREYWVRDLLNQQLIVFSEPMEGDYVSRLSLTSGNISPLAFPDVAVAVERLF